MGFDVIFFWTEVVPNSSCELSVAGNQWACIELGSSMVATAVSFAQQLSTVNTLRANERPAQVHGRTPIRLTSSTGTSRVAPPALAPMGWAYLQGRMAAQRHAGPAAAGAGKAPGAPTNMFEAVRGRPPGKRRGPWAANKPERGATLKRRSRRPRRQRRHVKAQAGAYSSPATTGARPGR